MFEKLKEAMKRPVVRIMESKIKEEVEKRITSAYHNENEDFGYRRISERIRTRDLPPIKQDKMIKVVDYLHDRNPQAKSILGTTADFVVGDGITFHAEREDTQAILDEFWKVNEWDLKQFDRIIELSKYGEQIYKPFVNKYSGIVNLGVFDPEQVDKIERDKENHEILKRLIPKQAKDTSKPTAFDIIHFNHKTDLYEGDIFHFAVNRGSHATRGKSDLLPIVDWLDMYDRSLFTMTERVLFLMAFVWDVEIEGAGQEELQKRLMELIQNPPKAGSFQLHNQLEKWKAISPDLRGADQAEFYKQVKQQLTSGSGFPMHWIFGDGEDINKATSQEITEPTYRQLKRRQKFVVAMFTELFKYQIQKAIKAKVLSGKVEDHKFTIIVPDPSRKEASVVTETLGKLMPAMAIGLMNNLLSEKTARQVTTMFVEQMGVEIEDKDEEEEINNDKVGPENQGAIQEAIKKVKEAISRGKEAKVKKNKDKKRIKKGGK